LKVRYHELYFRSRPLVYGQISNEPPYSRTPGWPEGKFLNRFL
jgi:hypothetical protein